MSAFSFLKKKQPKVQLRITEIHDFLDRFVESKELGTTIGILKRDLHSKKAKIEDLVTQLQTSTPKQILSERDSQVLENNKKAYSEKMLEFSRELIMPQGYDSVLDYLEQLSTKIELVAEESQRNFFILKEFIEEDVSAVAKKLMDIDRTIAQSRSKLDKTVLSQIKQIKLLIEDYYKTEQDIYELQKIAQEIENEKLQIYERRSQIEDKIRKIRQGPGYAELTSLRERKSQLTNQKNRLEKEIKEITEPLRDQLKKKRAKILKRYLEEPYDALLLDKDLKIEGLAGKNKLKKLQSEAQSLQTEIDQIERRLRNNSSKLNIKEHQGWIDVLDAEIKEQNKKIEKIGHDLEPKSLNLIRQKIKEKIKTLGIEVEIKHDERIQ